MTSKKLFDIHELDARKIDKLIKSPLVDVTVTSPPYFDMKDYGHKEQIGFGQSYQDYIRDLGIVFQKTFDVTKDTGTLWVIIDAMRKDGQLIPLPFDIANELKRVGWIFKDIIIWEKDKTVPWTHKGQMRNSFEYILLFSKTNNFNFYIDKVRTYDSLKKWWIRYPERYSPEGKAPTGIWSFPIPTQGSWGNGHIRHFCPLPEEMVAQILSISTNEEDVVFDPFSGTGTVLAKAHNMNRKYIGTELNPEYIAMFKRYLSNTQIKKRKEYESRKNDSLDEGMFKRTILNLRALKYGRLLAKLGENYVKHIRVEISKSRPQKTNHLIKVDFNILLIDSRYIEEFQKVVDLNTNKIPLSKFGIEPNFIYVQDLSDIRKGNKKLYSYTNKITHKFSRELKNVDILKPNEIILSSIFVDLNEKDFDEA